MSISSILSIARSALQTYQLEEQVASHNIANANTDGYSAQRAVVTAAPYYATADGVFGTGVQVTDIGRNRDAFLDATYRDESSGASAANTGSGILGRIGGVLGEPSDSGLAASLDAFWSAWDDLANDPSSQSARSVLAQRGAQVAADFNSRANGVAQVKADTITSLQTGVTRLNQLSTQVADLNHRIVALQSGGRTAGDLLDQRDSALDEMATLVPLQVIQHDNGSVSANVNGNLLVDGAQALSIRAGTDPATGNWTLMTARGTPVQVMGGGSIGAMMDAVNKQIPDTLNRLDTLAAGVATAVNAWHEQGVTASGQAGAFFDAANGVVTAGTIKVTDAVTADPGATIAAGTGAVDASGNPVLDASGNPVYAPGRNDIARGMAALRAATVHVPAGSGATDPLSSPPTSFADFYSRLVTDRGADTQTAQDAASVHQSLADQAQNQRDSVSGVSTDEELTHLLEAQSAYSAAAKIVTTVDQMMQDLLDMVP